jgi:serine kinase of HPr protein (carbohydrate metabolism regulator)
MTHPTLHASALVIGGRGVVIRGAAGSGKSSLVLQLLSADPEARLIADDRVVLRAARGRLLASPAPSLAGLLEIRGQGIRRLPHVSSAAIDLAVDLAHPDQCPRMPDGAERWARLSGITIPRIFIARGAHDGSARVLAALRWPLYEDA